MTSNNLQKKAEEVVQQARPYVETVEENLPKNYRTYIEPASTSIAALGFFMSGQARILPLLTGNREKIHQDNSDDGLIPLLSRLGVRFSSSNASTIIGLIKLILSITLAYQPTRRPAARWGLAYLTLGLLTRLHQGVTLTPALINMAFLLVPSQLVTV